MKRKRRLRYLKQLRQFADIARKSTSEGEIKRLISGLPRFQSISINHGWSTAVFVDMDDMESFSGRKTWTIDALREVCADIYNFYSRKYLTTHKRNP